MDIANKDIAYKLFNNAQKGNWDKIEEIVTSFDNIDLNIRDRSGNFIISYAIIANKIRIVELLVSYGAKLDIIDRKGKTILYIPIKFNYVDIFKLLIKLDNNVIGRNIIEILDNFGQNSLHYSIIFNNIEATNILLKYHNLINLDARGYNPIHYAFKNDYHDLCVTIVNNVPEHINIPTAIGETLLHISARNNNNKLINILLEKGANPNIIENELRTIPLQYTISHQNIKGSKLLIKFGSDCNIQDLSGDTSLHYAIKNGLLEIIEIISKNEDTNFNIPNDNHRLPLHIMIKKYRDENLKIFILNTKMNYFDYELNTPLHLIVIYDLWKKYYDILSKKKLDIFAKNKKCKTPLDYVKKEEQDMFLDLAASSYIFRIISKQIRVENYKFYLDKNIEDKTKIERAKKDILKSGKSFPEKINKKCVYIEKFPTTYDCKYVGDSLDIISGLLYLSGKYNFVGTSMTTHFAKNEKLLDYYETLKKYTHPSNFTNFCFYWINSELFYPINFKRYFKNSLETFKIFCVPIIFEIGDDQHLNYLIYDKESKELERFEPYGKKHPIGFNYMGNYLDSSLKNYFFGISPDIKYIPPSQFLPSLGFQYFDSEQYSVKHNFDPSGFCVLWCVFYSEHRIKYINISRKRLIKHLFREIKQSGTFIKVIRNYSKSVTQVRNNILKESNIDINKWISGECTHNEIEQIINVLKNKYV